LCLMNKTYSEKLKDPRWQKVRLAVLSRDNFTCRDCDDTTEELHVHHCFYRKGNPWDTETDFLLTLCKPCHQNREKIEGRIRELMGQAFSECSIGAIENVLIDFLEVLACPGYKEMPELSIVTPSNFEWESDFRWFLDLEQVTGSNATYNEVKALRAVEQERKGA